MHRQIPGQPDRTVVSAVTTVRKVAFAVVLAIALPEFVAWLVPSIGRMLPLGWYGMKANTALLILLTTASIMLTERRSKLSICVGRAIGILVFALAVCIFVQFLGVNMGNIDTLLAQDPRGVVAGRMSLQATIGFMFFGITCGMLGLRGRVVTHVLDILSLLLCLYFLSFAGSIFFTKDGLPGWSLSNQLSKQTFVCFCLLVLVLFIRRTEHGFFSILVQRGIGGRTARIAAPAAILLPFFIASLRELLITLHLLNRNYAIAVAPAMTATIALYFVIVLARKNRDIESALHNMSLSDELTGVYNRRGFNLLADQALNEARRARTGFTVAFFDVDNLKTINDELGHEDGSEMLRELAEHLRKVFRETDIIGRLGGDEFVVAAKNRAQDFAVVLQRLEEATAVAANRPFALAFSYGVITSDTATESLQELIDRADAAMYANKRIRKGLG
jgi:diguanylate cyclase (GGDEF)-like protein